MFIRVLTFSNSGLSFMLGMFHKNYIIPGKKFRAITLENYFGFPGYLRSKIKSFSAIYVPRILSYCEPVGTCIKK